MTTPVPESFNNDPALWMVTSLTAGSSHIVTATSRLETILRANRVPFKAVDIATNEKARMLWGRRAGKDAGGRVRKLPGLIQDGMVLGDLVEIEEWNEYGELKQNVKIFYDEFTIPSIKDAPKQAEPPKGPNLNPIPPQPAHKVAVLPPAPAPAAQAALPVRSIADEAAAKAKELRLQSLRDKVYGKGKTGPDDKDKKEEAKSEDGKTSETPELAPVSIDATAATADRAREMIQSPTSTAWKSSGPVDPPVTAHMGSKVVEAPADVIKALEKAEMIVENPEEESKAEKEESKSEKKKKKDESESEPETESEADSGSESEEEESEDEEEAKPEKKETEEKAEKKEGEGEKEEEKEEKKEKKEKKSKSSSSKDKKDKKDSKDKDKKKTKSSSSGEKKPKKEKSDKDKEKKKEKKEKTEEKK